MSNYYGSGGGGGGSGGGFRGGNNYGRGSYGGGRGGGDSYEKDNSVFVQQDTVFVSGMGPDVTENEIGDHFGAIGIIKKDKRTQKAKIWIYKDKETGSGKGECTITYDDPHTASSAIEWFDGKQFNGNTIKVQLAQRNSGGAAAAGGGGNFRGGQKKFSGGGGDRGGRNNYSNDGSQSYDRQERGGGGGGGGGGNHREGDWNCAECSNKNFAWRNECNRCKTPKAGGGGGGGGSGSGSSGGFRRDGGSSNGGDFRGGRGNNRDNRGGHRSRPY